MIACDDAVSSLQKPKAFVNSHVAYELVTERCKDPLQENRTATVWIANTDLGLWACVAKVQGFNLTLAGRYYKIQKDGSVHPLRDVEYTKVESYHCACSEDCTACSDSSTCVTCSYGFKLITDGNGPHCEKQASIT